MRRAQKRQAQNNDKAMEILTAFMYQFMAVCQIITQCPINMNN